MRISDWSSDVCSSDLSTVARRCCTRRARTIRSRLAISPSMTQTPPARQRCWRQNQYDRGHPAAGIPIVPGVLRRRRQSLDRSEEHTSELQSLMRISYAVFCLKKKIISDKLNTKHTKLTHNITIATIANL